jgi:LytS/YehU family sensor histidine kinase
MYEDVHAADRMIAQMGALLRATYSAEVFVPLRTEINCLNAYTAIMSERFRGSLLFDVTAAPQQEAIKVPALLLQSSLDASLDGSPPTRLTRVRIEVIYRPPNMQYSP